MRDADAWQRAKHIAGWPLAAYRKRISMQLILSSVLVVILTVALVEVMVVVLLLWLTEPPGDLDIAIDEQLGRQAASGALQLESSNAGDALVSAQRSEDDQRALELMLEEFLSGGLVAGADEETALPLGGNPRAALVSANGEIVASTDDSWAQTGEQFTTIDFPPARSAAFWALQLEGDATSFGNSYVLDYEDDTMASSHPVYVDGEFAGAVLLQADDVVNARSSGRGNLPAFAIGNVVVLLVLTVPALIAAAPVGIYRARRISRRLEALSAATATMGAGDLSARVDVAGHDEVAQVSRQFNAMVEQLDEADRTRRAFVSNVSHDLRTPVAILRGNLEQLLATGTANRGQLDRLHRETLTLTRLIDDLFALAKIEEAVVQVELGPVDLSACIADAVDSIAGIAWTQGKVSVEAIDTGGLPRVRGERLRIQQVLSNLLHNALRHTPEGGLIVVSARAAGDTVEVTVADTGIGIAPDDLEHIFDRYHQIERSGRSAGGAGLGLSIVQRLLETMDGTIRVESKLNQGTAFTFSLPISASD